MNVGVFDCVETGTSIYVPFGHLVAFYLVDGEPLTRTRTRLVMSSGLALTINGTPGDVLRQMPRPLNA